jgi:hypothetical protein
VELTAKTTAREAELVETSAEAASASSAAAKAEAGRKMKELERQKEQHRQELKQHFAEAKYKLKKQLRAAAAGGAGEGAMADFESRTEAEAEAEVELKETELAIRSKALEAELVETAAEAAAAADNPIAQAQATQKLEELERQKAAHRQELTQHFAEAKYKLKRQLRQQTQASGGGKGAPGATPKSSRVLDREARAEAMEEADSATREVELVERARALEVELMQATAEKASLDDPHAKKEAEKKVRELERQKEQHRQELKQHFAEAKYKLKKQLRRAAAESAPPVPPPSAEVEAVVDAADLKEAEKAAHLAVREVELKAREIAVEAELVAASTMQSEQGQLDLVARAEASARTEEIQRQKELLVQGMAQHNADVAAQEAKLLDKSKALERTLVEATTTQVLYLILWIHKSVQISSKSVQNQFKTSLKTTSTSTLKNQIKN